MANVVRRMDDPFRLVRDLLRWEPFEPTAAVPPLAGELYRPAFDVKETKDGYVFYADLPGVREQDLEIQVNGNRLSVSGKREGEARVEGETWFARERGHGAFQRHFVLPDDADPGAIDAQLKDGVLTLAVSKRAETRPRKIEIRAKSSTTA